jgi:Schlafen, AlbA_2
VSIFDKPAAAWIEDDLRELLGPPPQPETATLEFKGELHLDTPAEKNEAEKDIEGLANAGAEGVLIYGISEVQREDGSKVAGALTPVERRLAERLNNVLDDRGTPRVPFDLHQIPSADGGIYVAVVVYGHRRPHMASTGKYYVRRNLKVRAMTEAEVAEAYRDRLVRDRRATEGLVPDEPQGPDAQAAALASVEERVHRGLTETELSLYTEETGETTPPGWLSVFAYPLPLRPDLINPAEVDPQLFYELPMEDRWRRIEPPLAHYRFHRRLEGLDAQIPDRDDTYPRYLVRLWRDGLLEYGDLLESPFVGAPGERRVIPTHAVAQYVHDYLLLFARALRRLGYDGAVRAVARLDHIEGYTLAVDPARAGWIDFRALQHDEIAAEPWRGRADELEEDGASTLARDLLQRLFLAAGGAVPYFFDAEGNYIGQD